MVEPSGDRHVIKVDCDSVNRVRPYIVGAVLRGVTFDPKRYKSFIDLQDKLHQNICRRRVYASMGTHDLDTIQGPFVYRAADPASFSFIPLTEEKEQRNFSGKDLIAFYRENPIVKHLKPYADIIHDAPVYPVVEDSRGTVLSLPPVINSWHSRITVNTKNVFIECTNLDLVKANIVLDTVVAMFSEYCAEPFTVEPVDIVYESSSKPVEIMTTPKLSQRQCDARVDEINSVLGLQLSAEDICTFCEKMMLGPAEYISSSHSVRVNVPPTRSDILHAVDVIEDVGIAYGYNNIPQNVPQTLTVGAALPINQMTDLLRAEIGRAGYVEMLTHGLCSRAENFTNLRRPIGDAAALSNPANIEYEVVRTTLLPGALKTLAHNNSISHKDGVRLFEISDVVLKDASDAVGAKNVRCLTALYSAFTPGFEHIHGLVDRIMSCVQVRADEIYAQNSMTEESIADMKRIARSGVTYTVRHGSDPVFFPGMAVDVVLQYLDTTGSVASEDVIGTFGVVHPEVLSKFGVDYPCSALELNLEKLM